MQKLGESVAVPLEPELRDVDGLNETNYSDPRIVEWQNASSDEPDFKTFDSSIGTLLAKKQIEINRIRREIHALRIPLPLLEHDADDSEEVFSDDFSEVSQKVQAMQVVVQSEFAPVT